MAFRINVNDGFAGLQRRIQSLYQDDVPFVTAYALTKTAQDVQAAEVALMREVFDRPTRWALNSLFVRQATKQDLRASVEFKDEGGVPAYRFLGPQIVGGKRVKKSHERRLERAGILRPDEFVVPGLGAKLDAHGNMPGGEIERILSQLGAASGAGYDADMTNRSRKRNVKRAGGRYILLRPEAGDPGSKVHGRARAGIYLRKGAREIVPVMIFVRAPQYDKRFPFYEKAREVVRLRFAQRYREGWQRYVVGRPRRRAS